MIKKLVWAAVLVVTVWPVSNGLAQVSCTGSTIWLAVRPSLIGEAIPIT